jgi:hypothetical protein
LLTLLKLKGLFDGTRANGRALQVGEDGDGLLVGHLADMTGNAAGPIVPSV